MSETNTTQTDISIQQTIDVSKKTYHQPILTELLLKNTQSSGGFGSDASSESVAVS